MYDPFANPPMYPGGNPSGAPLPGVPAQQNPGGPVGPVPPGHHGRPGFPFSANNAFAGLMGPYGAQRQAFQSAWQDWRGQRPENQGFAPVAGGPQDFRSALMDWRQQRPTFRSYLSAQTPTTGMTTNPNAGI